MADETRQVIIEVDIKTENAIAELQDTNKKIADLEKQRAEQTDKSSEAYIRLTAEIKNLQKEQRAQQKVVEASLSSQKDSYNQLAAQYAKNTAELNKLSTSERTNTEEGRKLEAETLAIRNQMIALKEATNEHTLKVGNYENATKSLKQELRELNISLQQMKLAGQESSDAYKEMQQRAGQLKEAVNETSQEVKYFAQNASEQGLATAVDGLDAVAGAGQVVIGTMGLLSDDTEELEKSFAKLAVIEGVVNGVQRVYNTLQKESALMQGLAIVKTKALAAAQTLYNVVVGTSTGALKAFRIALASTGIGAIAIGIGYLITNWKELTGAIDENTDATQRNQESSLASVEDRVSKIDKLNKRQLENLKSDLQKEIEVTEDANIQRQISEEKFTNFLSDLREKQSMSMAETLEKEQRKSYEAKKQETVTEEQQLNKRLENLKTYLKSVEFATKAANETKKLSDEDLAVYELELSQQVAEYRKQELYELSNVVIETNEIIKESNKETSDSLVVDMNRVMELQRIEREANIEAISDQYERERELLKLKQTEELAMVEGDEITKLAINRKYKQYNNELDKAERDAKIGYVAEIAKGSLELLGKNAKHSKIAAIGTAVIDGILGVQKALASAPPPYNFALAAITGASAIANVNKIKNTKVDLPGANVSGGANAGAISVSGGGTTTNVPTSTTAEVGRGIVTRDTLAANGTTQVNTRPTLVVDDVTYKQNQQAITNKMATI